MKRFESGHLFFTTSGLLIVSLAWLLMLFIVFFYVGHFQLRQAMILALGFCLLTDGKMLWKPKHQPFEPFRIKFSPDFSRIFAAVGLVADREAMTSILQKRQAAYDGIYDVERTGEFGCTTLTLESDNAKQVVAWWPWPRYTTDYEFDFPLWAISFPNTPSSDVKGYLASGHSPAFFIGYYRPEVSTVTLGFGIEVDPKWWRFQKAANPAVSAEILFEEENLRRDTTRLILGELPIYQMTQVYRDVYSRARPIMQQVKREKDLDSLLVKQRWRKLDYSYQHKFMNVRIY